MSTEETYALLRAGVAKYCPKMLPLFPERPGRDEILTRNNMLSMQVAIVTARQLRRLT
jgi:hypothetical protein